MKSTSPPPHWPGRDSNTPPCQTHVNPTACDASPQSPTGGESQGAAECAAFEPKTAPQAPTDPDLAFIVKTWPSLPATVKTDVLAVVRRAVEGKR